jgi:hypothetical protein
MKFLFKLKKWYLKTVILYKDIPMYHLSEDLKNDESFMLRVVARQKYSLLYVSDKLKKDKGFVLKCVAIHGKCLCYASECFQKNKDVVMVAVLNDGYALKFASEELQNDKELLLLLEKDKYAVDYAMNYEKEWYEERMKVLTQYKEEDLLNNMINTESVKNLLKIKVKKF